MDTLNDVQLHPYIVQLRSRTATLAKRIALSDGEDVRALSAARYIQNHSSLKPILVGDTEKIRAKAQEIGIAVETLTLYDPDRDARQDDLIALLAAQFVRRKKPVPARDELARMASDPIYCGALLVKAGLADGMVGGAAAPTAAIIRAGIQVIGLDPLHPVVSGAFVMLLREKLPAGQDALVFADTAVVPNPDVNQLASITINTANTTRAILNVEPTVAMLSFSSYGSAQHPMVTKVQQALDAVRLQDPKLRVDGEMQVDAALIPEISERKAPGNSVHGHANVLIFPSLEAGNIAYKLVERVARATALGVILSGLARPLNDLSRGCSMDDIVNMVAVTALQCVQAETAIESSPTM